MIYITCWLVHTMSKPWPRKRHPKIPITTRATSIHLTLCPKMTMRVHAQNLEYSVANSMLWIEESDAGFRLYGSRITL